MDTVSNSITTEPGPAPATFSHPRGYINEKGEYAIWVGTPPGIDPELLAQETTITGTSTDFTPQEWAAALEDPDVFIEVPRTPTPAFEAALTIHAKRRDLAPAKLRS